jgi:hypothetical protein
LIQINTGVKSLNMAKEEAQLELDANISENVKLKEKIDELNIEV